MFNEIIPLLLLADGLVGIAMAVFAHALGIDPNPVWGTRRILILLGGMALIFAALMMMMISKRRMKVFWNPAAKYRNAGTLFLFAHLWVAMVAIYAWFVTYGNFTTWNHTSHYYTRLSAAFQEGHLYVDLNPGKGLLQSIDPYDPKSRAPFPDDIWDMSFYKGKLYYYWGPVPALIILPLQAFLDMKVSDNYLVFFFSSGLLVFNSLIILRLWRVFFAHIATRNVVVAIFLIGLILPVIWNTGVPYVYSVAVVVGHFFLMGGIYFAISALECNPPISAGKLFLAGVFFACAVGSRAIQALSVIFLALLIPLWIANKMPRPIHRNRFITAVGALYMPLAIGALAIGWYNWARFDSLFEFGLRYQITTYNLNEQANLIFKPDYVLLNLYAYLFQPFGLVSEFPFIRPVTFSSVLAARGITQPHLYYAGRVTGIVFSSPFLALGIIPLLSGVTALRNKSGASNSSYSLAIALFAGSFLTGFLSILFYFNAQTRFLTDTVSQITILAILGYWTLISTSQNFHPTWARIFLAAANGLLFFTICASFLLAISSETSRLETLNPLLFEKIDAFLNR